ncbi:MAG: 2-C-methyl-D-erythritol 4-phosphate cytidylyltransferase [Chloroflexi bacterium]|nr:2-C-methyl-D-erythritol 4-phosphate cytidylyltransferase [Chloroflexota bacterium]
MDAIVAAGGVPTPGDPLYPYTQGKPKALVEVAGKPMLQWVLEALSQAPSIDNIVVVGCKDQQGLLALPEPITFLPIQDNILRTVQTGGEALLEINPGAEYAVLSSADIPGITPESIDWVVNSALESEHDAYYNAIPRHAMEKGYPDSGRTFTKLKGLEVCGGDLSIAKMSLLSTDKEIFERLFAARKNPFKIASLVGYSTLFLLLTRLLTLEKGVERVSQSLGIKGRVMLCPYPEIGMDVDKPYQLELLRQDLK